jgi:hypothetical protein
MGVHLCEEAAHDLAEGNLAIGYVGVCIGERRVARIATTVMPFDSVEGLPPSREPRIELRVRISDDGAFVDVSGDACAAPQESIAWKSAVRAVCRSVGRWHMSGTELVRVR